MYKIQSQKLVQALLKLRPLIANFSIKEDQLLIRKEFNELANLQIKHHKKNYTFLDKPLPHYSKQELDKILSIEEKKMAASLEDSGIGEAAASYHHSNPSKKH